jgi:hypothetical protein
MICAKTKDQFNSFVAVYTKKIRWRGNETINVFFLTSPLSFMKYDVTYSNFNLNLLGFVMKMMLRSKGSQDGN